MSRRMILVIAAIVVVIALGTVLALKRALKASTTGADLDSGHRRATPTAPR